MLRRFPVCGLSGSLSRWSLTNDDTEVVALKRILKLFLFSLCLTGVLAGEAAALVQMSFPDYLKEILLNNHALRSSVKAVEANYYAVLAAMGAQRPSLGLNAKGAWLSEMNGEDNYTMGSAGLALTHRIDLSGKYSLDERQNVLGYEIARAQFDANVNALVATAEQTWWSAVLARENVRLQREILRQRAENHRVTLEKYRQQLVPKLDVVRSDAQVVEAETLVKRAETSYNNLLASLSYLAGGLDVEPRNEPLHVPAFDITLSYDEALKNRPDMRAAQLTLDRAKVVKKLTARGLSPTLDVSLQWTAWADPDMATTPQSHEAQAGLSLNVPLLDGHRTKYGVLNADRMVQSAEAALDSLKEETRQDLTVAMNNWKNAEALEVDKKRQMARSEEELRITELMYAEGMGAQIDLINAQTAYRTVRTEYLDAVKSMYVALVAMRKAVGDYAPNEDGAWKEAVVRYGKGSEVTGEVGLVGLRGERRQNGEASEKSPAEAKSQKKTESKKKR